jgi:hypothetical protein
MYVFTLTDEGIARHAYHRVIASHSFSSLISPHRIKCSNLRYLNDSKTVHGYVCGFERSILEVW